MRPECIIHADLPFFLTPGDFVGIGEKVCGERRAHQFAVFLRVLETWKNDRLRELYVLGRTEADICEQDLWLDVFWPKVRQRALRFFSSRTFQNIAPTAIKAGFASQRYIKRDQANQNITDEAGRLLVYATYELAQADKAHPGEIIHQILFHSDRVNEIVAAMYPTHIAPRPQRSGGPGPDRGDEGPGKEVEEAEQTTKSGDAQHVQADHLPTEQSPLEESAARGGNLQTVLSSASIHAYTPPSQTFQGGSRQNSHATEMERSTTQGKGEGSHRFQRGLRADANPPRQECEPPVGICASKKDLSNKNPPEESFSSASGATNILSHFDFFREFDEAAMSDLFALLLPLPPSYKSAERQQAALLATQKAVGEWSANPFLRERGLVHVARLLCYFADLNSPCRWRNDILQRNPSVKLRPWHLTKKVVYIASHEMEGLDWWPTEPALPSLWELERTKAERAWQDVESAAIDLAELAGIEAAARCGMGRAEARSLVEEVRADLPLDEFPDVFVDYSRIDRWPSRRGYRIHFSACGHDLRLYSRDDWNIVCANSAWLGTPEFAAHLAQAIRSLHQVPVGEEERMSII